MFNHPFGENAFLAAVRLDQEDRIAVRAGDGYILGDASKAPALRKYFHARTDFD